MRQARASIAGLMGAVLVAALSLAALRSASELWAGATFLATAAIEAGLAPLAGRLSDRRGALMPVRLALVGAIAVVGLEFVAPVERTAWFRA